MASETARDRVQAARPNASGAEDEAARQPIVGEINEPATAEPVEREYFAVRGWAVMPGRTVRCIEVLIDGAPVGRARLGLPWSKNPRRYPEVSGISEAAVSGFMWKPDPGDLPQHASSIDVAARVVSTDGHSFELRPPAPVRLQPPARDFDDPDGYAARLRARGQALLPARPLRGGEQARILAFTHRLDHGGAQRYFFEQVRYLLRDPRISCTVVSPADGPWRERLETVGAEVHLVDYPIAGVLEYESAVAHLGAWASHGDFDVAYVNTLDAFMGADLADRLGLPVVWAIHESFPLRMWWAVACAAGHSYVRQRIEHSLGRASKLIFAADATRRLYEGYADPERMITLPYGLELADIASFRERYGIPWAGRLRLQFPDDAILVVCVSVVNPRKSQAVLARAFGEVAGAHPKAHLVLIGDTGGTYSEGIRRFSLEARLAHRIRLIPVTPDAYSWHEVADVFALASDIESSPIAILEAMAFETPVVTTRVFGNPELIEDGVNGYLCEANDIADLAAALDRVLSADPAERARVARAGTERVRERHDPARYAESLRTLIEGAIDEHARGCAEAGRTRACLAR